MSASSLSDRKQSALDVLAKRLAQASMEVFVATTPEVRGASNAALEPAIRAMREASKPAVVRFLDDAKQAPWVAEPAFMVAVLEIAEAGRHAWMASNQGTHER